MTAARGLLPGVTSRGRSLGHSSCDHTPGVMGYILGTLSLLLLSLLLYRLPLLRNGKQEHSYM